MRPGLFSELRRRRVVNVAIVYAAAGWVTIEVASTVLPPLGAPELAVRLVIVLVALGFPVAMVLAWIFDLGPGGVHRTAQAPERLAAPVPALAQDAVAARIEPAAPAARRHDARRSIAVLPFVNMSGDAENEYFSDGISEEILNLLAKLPQLRVSSRTSSFVLQGQGDRHPDGRRQSWGRYGAGGQRASGRQSRAHHRAVDRRRIRLALVVGDLRPRAGGRVRDPGRHRHAASSMRSKVTLSPQAAARAAVRRHVQCTGLRLLPARSQVFLRDDPARIPACHRHVPAGDRAGLRTTPPPGPAWPTPIPSCTATPSIRPRTPPWRSKPAGGRWRWIRVRPRRTPRAASRCR